MIVLKKFWENLTHIIGEPSWLTILLVALGHMLISLLAVFLAGESELIDVFVYWYVVTASTVGYGDFSPTTTTGQYVTSLWVIPGGVAIFAAILGKAVSDINERVTMKRNGLGSFERESGHVIMVVDRDSISKTLHDQTKGKLGNTEKVIVTCETSNHKKWVKADSYADSSVYKQAGVENASRVVIMLDNDKDVLAATLTTAKLTKEPIVAFFNEQETADLVDGHFDNVEIVVSNSVAMVARSMADPGISRVIGALFDNNQGETIYAHHVMVDMRNMSIDDLEHKYKCSVIAVESYEKGVTFVNNSCDVDWDGVHTWYYIRKERIGV